MTEGRAPGAQDGPDQDLSATGQAHVGFQKGVRCPDLHVWSFWMPCGQWKGLAQASRLHMVQSGRCWRRTGRRLWYTVETGHREPRVQGTRTAQDRHLLDFSNQVPGGGRHHGERGEPVGERHVCRPSRDAT